MLLNLKYVTLMEEVETKEAEYVYKKMKARYIWFILVPLFILLTCFLVLVMILINSPLIMYFYQDVDLNNQINVLVKIMLVVCNTIPISGVILAIFISIYRKKMRPFKKLLSIARLNDKIRHEEKIRERERKRIIEEQNKITYEIDDIQNTIDKSEIYHIVDTDSL